MSKLEKLNYVESSVKSITAEKRLFESVFNCSFINFDEAYTTFKTKALMAVFFRIRASINNTKWRSLISVFTVRLLKRLTKRL